MRNAIERFEDWGINHLEYVVVFSLVLSVVAFVFAMTVAVLT